MVERIINALSIVVLASSLAAVCAEYLEWRALANAHYRGCIAPRCVAPDPAALTRAL